MNKNIFVILLLSITFKTNSQRIYLNSIPKCGTHLLMSAAKIITKRNIINTGQNSVTSDNLPTLDNNSIVTWHVKYSKQAYKVLKENKFIGLFIYRDPRDKVISEVFWVIKFPELLMKRGMTKENLNFNQLLRNTISKVKKEYDSYLPWTSNKLFHSVKFEDLVGPRGGGTLPKQKLALIKICSFLKINLTDQLSKDFFNNIYGNTSTFREGKIGSWKKYFTEEHKNLFKKVAGQLLIDLGYEKNLNW